MKFTNQAVNLSDALDKNDDMTSKENDILKFITNKISFIPSKNIWRSRYWGKNLGASHWLGIYHGKDAVLKIQGVKTDISEIYMINEFSKQNKSKLIEPPRIYEKILWSDKNSFEAIITNHANGGRLIEDGKVVTSKDVSRFFNYYKEYRSKCLPANPWLPKFDSEGDLTKYLGVLRSASLKAYPESDLRQEKDVELAKNAYLLLSRIYKDEELEFVHGHFSCKDLIFCDDKRDKVVLFSNLFWKWRYPYFDAVFAYHWFMYELAHVNGIKPSQVEEQRKIWLDEIL